MWDEARRLAGSLLGLLRLVPRRHIAAALAILAALSALEGAGVLLLLPLLALVGVESSGGRGEGLVDIAGRAFAGVGLEPSLGLVLALYVSIVAAQSALQRGQALVASRIRLDVLSALRRRLYLAISRARWEFLVRRRVSDFLHVLMEETGRVGGAANWAMDLCASVAVAAVYLGFALFMSPAVTLLVVGLGLVFTLASQGPFARARTIGDRVSDAGLRLYGAMAEQLSGLKTTKAYGVVERQAELVDRELVGTWQVHVDAAAEYASYRQAMTLGSTLGLAVVVYVAVGLLAMPTADLLVLLFVFSRLMPRVTSLHEKVQAIAGEMPAFGAVSDLTRQCAAAAEPPAADTAAPELTREIRLEGVSFTYQDDRSLPAVEGLDVTIPSGRTTAIVGPSGSGKSTTVDLLLGLLTPQQGRILVDGTPLTPDVIGAWRRQVGYVPQETLLFHTTIRENLLWARPEATDEQISEALRLAAADGFVSKLPRGLETVVGDRGVLLSGGERQRLSLARALLRRPRLLVLDEATSSLDSENEMRIQHAIDGLHTQVTMVIVTHRLSTIRSADFIYVLDHGRAVERGTWGDLTARRTGRFVDLCRAQGWQP